MGTLLRRGILALLAKPNPRFAHKSNIALSAADYPPEYDKETFEHPLDFKVLRTPIFEPFLYQGPFFPRRAKRALEKSFFFPPQAGKKSPPIYNVPANPHERAYLRASWKLKNGAFLPMTFLIDLGAPQDIYLSYKARNILADGGRIQYRGDIEAGSEVILVDNEQTMVNDTPLIHQPANIIGINLACRMSLRIYRADGVKHIVFDKPLVF